MVKTSHIGFKVIYVNYKGKILPAGVRTFGSFEKKDWNVQKEGWGPFMVFNDKWAAASYLKEFCRWGEIKEVEYESSDEKCVYYSPDKKIPIDIALQGIASTSNVRLAKRFRFTIYE